MRLQRPELGLRARVTLAFAGGALALSAALSGVSYGLVRNYLVDQTETAALREAFVNATVTRDGLRSAAASLPRILASLQDPDGSPSLVFHGQDAHRHRGIMPPGGPRCGRYPLDLPQSGNCPFGWTRAGKRGGERQAVAPWRPGTSRHVPAWRRDFLLVPA